MTPGLGHLVLEQEQEERPCSLPMSPTVVLVEEAIEKGVVSRTGQQVAVVREQ